MQNLLRLISEFSKHTHAHNDAIIVIVFFASMIFTPYSNIGNQQSHSHAAYKNVQIEVKTYLLFMKS